MKFSLPIAVLLGCLLIGAAIYLRPMSSVRYQVAGFAPGSVVRVDAKTGVLELCGSVEIYAHLAGRDIQSFRDSGATEAQINALLDAKVQSMQRTNCFVLNHNERL
jgi:hypothetical protein